MADTLKCVDANGEGTVAESGGVLGASTVNTRGVPGAGLPRGAPGAGLPHSRTFDVSKRGVPGAGLELSGTFGVQRVGITTAGDTHELSLEECCVTGAGWI